jgi:hypothetical protein
LIIWIFELYMHPVLLNFKYQIWISLSNHIKKCILASGILLLLLNNGIIIIIIHLIFAVLTKVFWCYDLGQIFLSTLVSVNHHCSIVYYHPKCGIVLTIQNINTALNLSCNSPMMLHLTSLWLFYSHRFGLHLVLWSFNII